ncbi:MAG TPA: DUF6094 domain-containing protein, partial [Ktedonobacteraceae bacterium]|nr:DUF6094 domain-containing protein [Ktedonobacteraceae bacterium]
MRLAGRFKLGYYPLPPLLAGPLARLVRTATPTARIRMLDPCCGEGTALKLIAEAVKQQHSLTHGRWSQAAISTWGIELDQVRAKQAASQLDHVLATSYFSTTLSTGSGTDGGWQFAFVNPIYDEGSEVLEGERGRQEVQFLKRTTERCADYAVVIWVIPQHVLGRRGVAPYLAEHYDRQVCFRFPDVLWRPPGKTEEVEMYAQFKQIIWIGRKLPHPGSGDEAMEAQIAAWAAMGETLPPLPLEGDSLPEPYVLPNAPSAAPVRYFLAGSFDPDALARRLGQFGPSGRPREGLWSQEEFWAARFPDLRHKKQAVGHGLHAFKQGYTIAFAVGGLITQAELTSKSGRRLLIKGHTRKTRHISCSDDGHEIIEKVTDRFESALWGLDLDTMSLVLIEVGSYTHLSWGVEHETMSMKEFLADFGDSLMEQVQRLNEPRYQGPHQVPWARRGFAYLRRRPLGKQLDAILAQVHALVNRMPFQDDDEPERLDRLAEVAEMGAGKTYMAMVTAFLADLYACGCAEEAPPGARRLSLFPLVVLSPAIMAPKWKREWEETIPNVKVLIVEKFGPTRGKQDEEEEESDSDRDLRAAQAASGGAVDGRTAFRQFDPTFTGTALGLVGSLEQAVACMRRELAAWRQHYDVALAHNREERAHGGDDLWPLPLKPAHVLILTFHDARTMPAWMPVWRMKPARVIDRTRGTVRLLRRRSDLPEERTPIWFPACPHCMRMAKDEQLVRKGGLSFSEPDEESMPDQRQAAGRQLGLQLLAAEERLQQYLLSLERYAVLAREQAALLEGRAPHDEAFAHLEHEGADKTALSRAREALASACGRMLGLTGTLSNGYAS